MIVSDLGGGRGDAESGDHHLLPAAVPEDTAQRWGGVSEDNRESGRTAQKQETTGRTMQQQGEIREDRTKARRNKGGSYRSKEEQ